MPERSDDVILTTEEVAERLKVSSKYVLQQARCNLLSGFRVGRTWRFKQSAVDAWVEAASRT